MEPRLAPVPVAVVTGRNGPPPQVPYAWRARRYPWARRAIAVAEARYGKARPVCVCGAPLRHEQAAFGGRCGNCPPLPA